MCGAGAKAGCCIFALILIFHVHKSFFADALFLFPRDEKPPRLGDFNDGGFVEAIRGNFFLSSVRSRRSKCKWKVEQHDYSILVSHFSFDLSGRTLSLMVTWRLRMAIVW